MTPHADDIAALAVEANLAPSVHNTQPTRWRLEGDGSVLVLEDVSRLLRVGDPAGRDAAVSHGAAIEGFVMACAAQGARVDVELLKRPASQGLRPVARLTFPADRVAPDNLRALVPMRRTYRGAFVGDHRPALLDKLEAIDDVRLVRTSEGVARLAELNDAASLKVFRNSEYRAELLSWMRLSPRDPRWSLDGLNALAMEMSGIVALGAGVVLRPGVFEALDRVGLARPFIAEADVVRSAQAVVLFHRPVAESPFQTGRRFYRLWLEFAELGLSAAPMAVLADDEPTQAIIAREFQLPADHRLVTGFRIGVAPFRSLPPKPRLPASALLV